MHPHHRTRPFPRAARTARVVSACLGLATLAPTTALIAQAKDTTSAVTLAKPGEPLFTVRDAIIAGGFTLATVALFPVDRHIAGRLQDSTRQANRFFHHAATGLELITSPGAYIIGGSLYLAGRLSGKNRLADFGWHGTEAVLLSEITTGLLKGFAGRARPYVTADTNAASFSFGKGFKHAATNSSFPSGHTSTAFAAAAAVTAETVHSWPRATWVVGPVMYGGATLVGLSRMYHNKHWASDVALGAAIGTFSGLKVVQYTHANPTNRIDRFMLRTRVVTTADGNYGLGWSLPFGSGAH